jgi:hypothetical protein
MVMPWPKAGPAVMTEIPLNSFVEAMPAHGVSN